MSINISESLSSGKIAEHKSLSTIEPQTPPRYKAAEDYEEITMR